MFETLSLTQLLSPKWRVGVPGLGGPQKRAPGPGPCLLPELQPVRGLHFSKIGTFWPFLEEIKENIGSLMVLAPRDSYTVFLQVTSAAKKLVETRWS